MSMRILIANMRQNPYRIQKQPPEVFYKKGVFKTFANFTGNFTGVGESIRGVGNQWVIRVTFHSAKCYWVS